MSDPRDDVAETFRQAAERLERAASHCRTAAQHYDERNVLRGCAHAFAALGDLAQAREAIETNAKTHAAHAQA